MSRRAAKDSFAPAGAQARRNCNHGLACGFALSRSRFAQPWLSSYAALRLKSFALHDESSFQARYRS